jgi:L-alanine-DL-glutamate epimerase-like enolase superfamily enzyme
LTLFDPLDRISQGHIAVDRTPGLGVQADHAAIAPFLFAECPAPRPGNR